ncbi:unnamed protein product [Paramecium sonneborni]|uniref:Uncharacterized protein n=1 Tax=Paramecium sonneborni TaxID=65129 RepID=A0A8S1M7X5_9CILI|nr:unnamed protein product [Paramecium sonneborni]
MGTCGGKNKNKTKQQLTTITQQTNPRNDEKQTTQQNQNNEQKLKGANDQEQIQPQQVQNQEKPQEVLNQEKPLEVQSLLPQQNQEQFKKLSEAFGNKNPPSEIPASLIVISKQKYQEEDPAQHHLECLKNQNEEGQCACQIRKQIQS